MIHANFRSIPTALNTLRKSQKPSKPTGNTNGFNGGDRQPFRGPNKWMRFVPNEVKTSKPGVVSPMLFPTPLMTHPNLLTSPAIRGNGGVAVDCKDTITDTSFIIKEPFIPEYGVTILSPDCKAIMSNAQKATPNAPFLYNREAVSCLAEKSKAGGSSKEGVLPTHGKKLGIAEEDDAKRVQMSRRSSLKQKETGEVESGGKEPPMKEILQHLLSLQTMSNAAEFEAMMTELSGCGASTKAEATMMSDAVCGMIGSQIICHEKLLMAQLMAQII
jgi:hypothetical protein